MSRHSQNRVHNCEVHSFVFAVPPPVSSAAATTGAAASSSSAMPALPSALASASASASMSSTASAAVVAGPSGACASRLGSAAALAVRPQVKAYLAGQVLTLACAARMPLQAVAHVNRVLRRFSPDGLTLTEAQFSVLLAGCGLGPQEIRWLFCALDREGGGRVASSDFLLALMTFYSGEGEGEGAGATGARASVGLMELRARYQREVSRFFLWRTTLY